MILTLILGFILGAAAILFILENTALVTLSFLQLQFETSIALLVLLAILVGAILALLFTLPGAISSSFALRKLRKQNETLAQASAQHKQEADVAKEQLMATHSPRPDVIDLSRTQ